MDQNQQMPGVTPPPPPPPPNMPGAPVAASDLGHTTTGMDPKVAGLLCYLAG